MSHHELSFGIKFDSKIEDRKTGILWSHFFPRVTNLAGKVRTNQKSLRDSAIYKIPVHDLRYPRQDFRSRQLKISELERVSNYRV